jgi:hypothetical protein
MDSMDYGLWIVDSIEINVLWIQWIVCYMDSWLIAFNGFNGIYTWSIQSNLNQNEFIIYPSMKWI